MDLKIGAKGEMDTMVTRENTAKAAGSGHLLVFSTPAMVGLMEGAACNCLAPFMEEGTNSVGTMVNIRHVSATPVGMEVRAEATVTAVDGRKISFDVIAYDEKGEIGSGTHERFIINEEKFLAKCYDKI